MKKYKHKKLGITATLNKDGHYHFIRETKDVVCHEHIHKSFIENSNDWEEVKEDIIPWYIEDKIFIKDPIETIISDKYPIKNMIKAKTYETLEQKLFTSSIIYTATDGISIRERDKTTLYLLNKDDLSIVKPFYKVDIFNFSKQDKEVADRYLTFTSEENRDKYIKENTKKPVFVSADGKDMYEGYRYYVPQLDFEGRLKGTYLEFITDKGMTSDGPKKFSTKSAAQEYIDNNKPRFSLADIEKCYFEGRSCIGFIEELKKLGK